METGSRKGDVKAAMTFQGESADHGRPSLARPEPSLIMRSSAWVALICVNDTDDGARHSNCAAAKKQPRQEPSRG